MRLVARCVRPAARSPRHSLPAAPASDHLEGAGRARGEGAVGGDAAASGAPHGGRQDGFTTEVPFMSTEPNRLIGFGGHDPPAVAQHLAQERLGGAVVVSPVQAATTARMANMAQSRKTASLRASLNVYVIGSALSDAPCDGPNHSRTSTTTLGLILIYGNFGSSSMTKKLTSHD